MVRLMLVLAPIACVLSAIAVSSTLVSYCKFMKPSPRDKPLFSKQGDVGALIVGALTIVLIMYTFHCTWVFSFFFSLSTFH